MAITDAIKRAPRWAWLTAAGVGIGAGAIKLYKDRGAEPTEEGAGELVDGAAQVGVGQASTMPPAIVVPPIVTGASGDQGSAVAGMSVWADATGDIIDILGGVTSQLVGVTGDIALGQQDVIKTAWAGGPPGRSTQEPSPIVVNVPAPQPAPAPVPTAPAPRRMIKQCGTSYNGQDKNCRHYTVQYYSDGTSQKVNDHRMHMGKCSNPGTNCVNV